MLVALIIELDNEFEQRLPHCTTNYGGSRELPWLTSVAMWSTCLRFVGEEGIRVADLEKASRTHTNLRGMVGWGYIKVLREPRLIRLTRAGTMARELWPPVFSTVEERWRKRFGEKQVAALEEALRGLIGTMQIEHLPDCLPIVGYGLFSQPFGKKPPAPVKDHDDSLYALLSRVLLAFAMEFEKDAPCSLAIAANMLRLLTAEGIAARELPRLSGVSKEMLAVAAGYLAKRKLVTVATQGGRKQVFLTPAGAEARELCNSRVQVVEKSWKHVRPLRECLAHFSLPDLLRGAEPYPDGWRARVPARETLPHFPLVTHRGGFPDGS